METVAAGSVGGPAAVDGQDDAGETAGGTVGEQQGGAGDPGAGQLDGQAEAWACG
jgi:hypothetical protein